jgi:hypothetical protein
VDDDGEIAPKSERDKQFGHYKYRSEQQMGRVVYQRRLPTLKHPVTNNLRRNANYNQEGSERPHAGSCRMTNDHGSARKQYYRSRKDRGSEREVEQEPVDEHRYDSDGRRAGLEPEYGDGPQAERENGGQEQEHDAEDMHRAIPGVTMIFNVIRKLPPKK